MSQITTDFLTHLANLAALPLTQQEKEQYQQQFDHIIEHMNKIRELNLQDIPETYRTTEEDNIWHNDTIQPSFSQEETLQNAPRSHNGYFVVPRIIEEQ